MTQPTPAKKAHEILDRLEGLTPGADGYEFELQRLRREAEALVHRPGATEEDLTVYGAILCSLGKAEECKSAFRRAMQLAPVGSDVRHNFALALLKLGDLAPAAEMADSSLALNPGSLARHDFCVWVNLNAGRLTRAVELLDTRDRLNPGELYELEESARSAYGYLITRGVNETVLQELCQIAQNVMRAQGVRETTEGLFILEDEEDDWLSVQFFVCASPDEISDLNVALAEALAETDLIPAGDSRVSVAFMKMAA